MSLAATCSGNVLKNLSIFNISLRRVKRANINSPSWQPPKSALNPREPGKPSDLGELTSYTTQFHCCHPKADLETKAILKQCIQARAALAELKGAAELIPNPSVLINTLPLLEESNRLVTSENFCARLLTPT